ncbi:MAG: DNA-binding transcriptional MerR regulator [Lentimonas sp.]|jgi:DNA-binding transcriptional MerR regulator
MHNPISRRNKVILIVKLSLFSIYKSPMALSKISENELTKLYYSIGEVALMFDVNSSLIRFWEKEFKQINPKKNKKGNRLFTPKDILVFASIYSLVKEEGRTLEGAKAALKERPKPQKEAKKSDMIKKLEEIKSKLIKLKSVN